jgi:hypothetical protein
MLQTTFLASRNIKVDDSQIVEPDICRNKHGGVDTSVQADKRVEKSRDRAVILGYIRASGAYGMTLYEMGVLLDRECNRISGRFTELKRDGLIVATEATRPTYTGSPAHVYVAVAP